MDESEGLGCSSDAGADALLVCMPSPCGLAGTNDSRLADARPLSFGSAATCEAMETEERHLKDISDGFARRVRRLCGR